MLTGLRGRLAALLALVSAVTLAVCALALLRPLEQLLTNNALNSLTHDARQGMPALIGAAGQPPHPSRVAIWTFSPVSDGHLYLLLAQPMRLRFCM